MNSKVQGRRKRHKRIRKTVKGTAGMPRLSVFRSARHIYAQVIDDTKGATIVSASSVEKAVVAAGSATGNVSSAKAIGGLIATRAVEKGIKKVVFDRGGFLYHGRIKALADSARESGLVF